MPVGNPSDPGAPASFIPAEPPPGNPMATASLEELTRLGLIPPDTISAAPAAEAVAAAVGAVAGAPGPAVGSAAGLGMVIRPGSNTPAPAPVPQMYVRQVGSWLVTRMGAGQAMWWDLFRAEAIEFMPYPDEPWQGLTALVYVPIGDPNGRLVGVWATLDEALAALDAGTR